jgi:hypothetical protein
MVKSSAQPCRIDRRTHFSDWLRFHGTILPAFYFLISFNAVTQLFLIEVDLRHI